MPQRKRVRRFDASTVQGDGAWIEVAQLTVGEARKAEEVRRIGDDDSFDTILDLYQRHVISWNWVDDDGEPMALPRDNPDIVDGLTADEFSFIGDCLAGSEEDQKK
jgi:hypothetical protein